MKKIIVYTDGGSRNNPGIAGIGVFITDEKGKVLKKAKKFLGIQTNNWAEYEGVIFALETLKQMFGSKTKDLDIELRLDSQLVERQLNGIYKIKEPSFKGGWFSKYKIYTYTQKRKRRGGQIG